MQHGSSLVARRRTSGASRLLLLGTVLFLCCSVPDYQFVPPPDEARCDDRTLNGTETDVDCGGRCEPCANGKGCRADADCSVASCVDYTCQASHCVDQTQADGETDVDCGGPDCPRCGVGQACVLYSDCRSNSCVAGECVATGCDDEAIGGSETDMDCGGGTCPPCQVGSRCELGGDCVFGICLEGICSTEACGNALKDPDEQGVDCGGACPKACDAEAACSNSRQTEAETDVDCGGGTCPRCADDRACLLDADCMSNLCTDGVCTAPCVDDCGAAGADGAGGRGGTAGTGALGLAGEGGESGAPDMGGRSGGGSGGTAATAGGGGASAAGGAPQGGDGAGGSGAGAGTGGAPQGGTGAAGSGGADSGAGGMGGWPVVDDPTCSGCARLEVPLASPSDKANFAITLPATVNFASATVTMRVYRQAGSGGQLKGYVQHSGSPDFLQLFQTDAVDLSALNGWQTVTWDVGAETASYDKTIVGRVGVQITGAESTSWINPTVVYVDRIAVSGASAGPWPFNASSSISTSPATTAAANILFCNSGDSPVSGSGVTWYSRAE